ncbi:hypothetical protein BH20ACT5_BH20ACT5_24510 [soil metagenome]
MPREVRTASVLLLAIGVLLVISGSTGLLLRGEVAQALAEQGGASGMDPALLERITLIAAAVVLVLGALLTVAGIGIRRGRQWARVTAFAGCGITIALNTLGVFAGAGLLTVALLGAGVGVVALLAQGSVGPFFSTTQTEAHRAVRDDGGEH